MPYTTVDSSPALNVLADRILDPGRRNTIVVLSVRSRNRMPGFDPHAVADGLAGTDVDVALLADPWDGATLGNLVNGRITAYNGAASVVPPYGSSRTFLPDRDDAGMIVDLALEHASFTGRGLDPDGGDASTVRELKRLRRENKKLKGELRRAGGSTVSGEVIPPADLYSTAMLGDWLDLAVRVMWALSIDASDKDDRPLPVAWSYADGFPAAVAGSAMKGDVIRCMVRVLLGVDEGHALRAGSNGAPIRRGAWGNPVWRSYVKQGSPNAPRLHWTRDDKGGVVFLESGGHDDLI